MEQHLNFARNLHIETRILEGDDVASRLSWISGGAIRSPRSIITRPAQGADLPALSRDPAQRIVDIAKDMQIVIVSEREQGR